MVKGLEKFNELVESFANLPTIGKKTAIRLAYHLCINNQIDGMKLAHNIENAIRFIKPCEQCGALSENELCEICSDEERNKNILCIVESPKDILTLEESQSYNGLYFVLDELNEEKLEKLKQIILKLNISELIFALTHSINSDATIFFIEDKFKGLNLTFSKIAQGIPSGVNLENVDLISLNKAMNFRTKI
ncbi:recombination protein RecR [Campylobacter jejuni]|uniref:Recombination protein RecR n=8 Tax=Campylobacter TaxID=194 RepID=RECR_CAMJJ|nr:MULTISPECIES: recombination mediator RecR [Campylobacter]A1W0P8.1 RecName: Full=Recombination protein RecR [Campylobacter jejuni subsp. jejuni 81-176]ADT66535.1 recombination protein RecR [Campylobacter jejuni subsp. jejuni ICDCCJ07001]APA81501.1 Recombination protein RecR [Campylobacter jejuni subsp. jejuni D42a]EAI2719179.1 recombination protein RecR [Campylobacter coli]EAJ6189192.1 recombination protein RecR [Campylobacter fetus]EDK22521.1 recombination protein [Campylobacter jejuni sub